MKTKILMALLCLCPLFAVAQNYEQQGDELYAQGQYDKAEKKYRAAIEISGASSSLQAKKEKCSKCVTLLAHAKSAEENASDIAGYKEASRLYSDLYAIHALPTYRNKANALQRKADTIREQQRAAEQAERERQAQLEAERKARLEAERQAERERKAREYIPEGTKVINKGTFKNRLDIKNIIIPNSVTSIGDEAFACCNSLTSVTIGNSVTGIGYGAFGDCSSLTSVTIGNNVTSIGVCAFRDCNSLTSVIIPNSVTSIGNSAFYGCSGVTSIVIPNSVTTIGNWAFKGCSGLTSVVIPSSVTSIEDDAFEGCRNLTIKIPENLRGKIKESDCKKVIYY